mmetsp:Transcript_66889/g.150278  ORF Transcript_66889/g.150278 Transcript_66889/m.150278 type:complete len:293 (-) Transcript_66889:396-1274(-)
MHGTARLLLCMAQRLDGGLLHITAEVPLFLLELLKMFLQVHSPHLCFRRQFTMHAQIQHTHPRGCSCAPAAGALEDAEEAASPLARIFLLLIRLELDHLVRRVKSGALRPAWNQALLLLHGIVCCRCAMTCKRKCRCGEGRRVPNIDGTCRCSCRCRQRRGIISFDGTAASIGGGLLDMANGRGRGASFAQGRPDRLGCARHSRRRRGDGRRLVALALQRDHGCVGLAHSHVGLLAGPCQAAAELFHGATQGPHLAVPQGSRLRCSLQADTQHPELISSGLCRDGLGLYLRT